MYAVAEGSHDEPFAAFNPGYASNGSKKGKHTQEDLPAQRAARTARMCAAGTSWTNHFRFCIFDFLFFLFFYVFDFWNLH